MAKGHMKCPKKGIRSTTLKASKKGALRVDIPAPSSQAAPPILPIFDGPQPYEGPAYGACSTANLIPDDESMANVFCFGAFADKVSGVVYNDLIGNFPFMSIGGSVFFCNVSLQNKCNLGEADL
jgi:hypothetical protein